MPRPQVKLAPRRRRGDSGHAFGVAPVQKFEFWVGLQVQEVSGQGADILVPQQSSHVAVIQAGIEYVFPSENYNDGPAFGNGLPGKFCGAVCQSLAGGSLRRQRRLGCSRPLAFSRRFSVTRQDGMRR